MAAGARPPDQAEASEDFFGGARLAFTMRTSVACGRCQALELHRRHMPTASPEAIADGTKPPAPDQVVSASFWPLARGGQPGFLGTSPSAISFLAWLRRFGAGPCQTASKTDPRLASKIDPPVSCR
jgi:hypothetical protein